MFDNPRNNMIFDGSLPAPAAIVGPTVLGWRIRTLVLIIAWKSRRGVRPIPAEAVYAASAGS